MVIIPCLIASTLFGIAPSIINIAIRYGENGNAIELWGMLAACIVSGGIAVFRHSSLIVPAKQLLRLFIFGSCGFFLCPFFLVSAYERLPVSTALLFHYCYPAMVVIFMKIVYRQQITWVKTAACLLSISGLFIIADFSSGLSFPGCLFAAASGAVYGLYVISCEKSKIAAIPDEVRLFHMCFAGACCFAVLLTLRRIPLLLHHTFGLFCAVGSGLMTHVIAASMIILSVRLIGASNTTIVNSIEEVVAVAFSALVFNESFTSKKTIAAVLILGGSLLAGISASENRKMPRFRRGCEK